MSARKEKKADLTLDPPLFTLEKNPDLEIFTFRMPSRIPLNSLDKLEFDLSGTEPCTFQAGDVKYKLQLGTDVENESFRVLVPKAKAKKADDKDSDDSDDDDNDEDEKYLQPASIPFSRHFNVLAITKEMTERIVAPRQDKAPANVDPMFRAYAHVPQKTGLKRRWMPLGVPVAAAAAEPKRAKRTATATPMKKQASLSKKQTATTPMKEESSPSKKQKGDSGKKSTTPRKEANGKRSEAKSAAAAAEPEKATTTGTTTTPMKKESSPSKKHKGDNGKKSTTPSKETSGKSSEAKPKRIKLEGEDTDGDATPLRKEDKKSAKKEKEAKKEAKREKKESKKKRKSSVKKEEE